MFLTPKPTISQLQQAPSSVVKFPMGPFTQYVRQNRALSMRHFYYLLTNFLLFAFQCLALHSFGFQISKCFSMYNKLFFRAKQMIFLLSL